MRDVRGLTGSIDRWPQIISGVGVLLGVVLIAEGIVVVITPGFAYNGYVVGVVTSIPFIGGLVYGGYWIEQSMMSPEHYDRIARWWAGGMLATSLLISGVVWSMRPMALQLLVGTIRWSAVIGGSLGLMMGVLQARAIQHAVETEHARRRKQETEQERDRLEEFASIVSHDLRNPLAVAQGHLDLLREEYESPHTEEVSSALDRMDSIIEDTLTLARAGQTVGETAPVDLSTLANGCWRTVETTDATLTIVDTVRIHADEDRLRHLFENLFRNAIDHGGEETTIRVGCLEDAAGFYVEDDGPGIPDDKREQVFESGYSGSSEGTGFGLSIVRKITIAHGWEIIVTDSETGGARFEITDVEVVNE